MKNFKRYISYVAVFAMLFTSCSKEETGVNVDSEKATLSFGAIVNDLVTNRSADKQSASDIPECSDDTPTYVEIVLMQGDEYILGTTEEPYRVALASGQVFTAEDENLELEQGNYSLVHFSVYNNDDDLIWIAPRAGSDLAGYLDRSLPLAIDLRAGVKKYVDVPVLCFDNRDVNEYGYLFFELDANIAIQYCFFANYCNDDGRHYPASYTVSIWAGTNSSGVPLYTDVPNNTGQYSNGDYFATPLCFALPDNDGELDEDYLYYEVTLSDWNDAYGEVDAMVKHGTLSKQDIMNTWEGDDDSNYNHLRFGCAADDDGGTPPVDSDGDGVPDSIDQCPNVAGPASNNGCPVDTPCDQTNPNADCDNDGVLNKCDQDNANYASFDCDGDGVLNGVDECPNVAGNLPNGCIDEADPCSNLDPVCSIPQTQDSLDEFCYLLYADYSNPDGYVLINNLAGTIELENLIGETYVTAEIVGTLTNDVLSLAISLDGTSPTDRITAYEIEVRPNDGSSSPSDTCYESQCNSNVTINLEPDENQAPIVVVFDDFFYDGLPIFVRIKAVACEQPVAGP